MSAAPMSTTTGRWPDGLIHVSTDGHTSCAASLHQGWESIAWGGHLCMVTCEGCAEYLVGRVQRGASLGGCPDCASTFRARTEVSP